MSNLKIACQTITWGDDQKEKFPEIFENIASYGYHGVEIGFRHIIHLDPVGLKTLLDKHGLEFAGTHVGGNLVDTGQADEEKKLLDKVIDFLKSMNSNLLIYSGLKFQNEDQFENDLKMINTAAENCSREGIDFLYHNHSWEFHEGMYVMNTLLERATEHVKLCPDLGWLSRAGIDLLSFMEDNKKRIAAIHFKDFKSKKPIRDSVALGSGIVPLKVSAEFIRHNFDNMWIIAEQDFAEYSIEEEVEKNAEFLKKTIL